MTGTGIIRRRLIEALDHLHEIPFGVALGGELPEEIDAWLEQLEREVAKIRKLRGDAARIDPGQGTFMFVATGVGARLLPCPVCSTLVVSGELHHCDHGVAHAPGLNPFAKLKREELLKLRGDDLPVLRS